MDTVAFLSICISAGIFATTIHSQDFKDTEGDSAIGRKTVPIVYPNVARYTVLVPLVAWSIGLSVLWWLDVLTAAAFTLLAVFIGYRYLNCVSVHADQVSFYWYNVSSRQVDPAAFASNLIPLFCRFGCPPHMRYLGITGYTRK